MKIRFTPLLYQQVVEDCLVSAGELGQQLLSNIDWPSCTYEIIEIAGKESYPEDDYSKHIFSKIRHPGTFESPDNIANLSRKIIGDRHSIVTRDFAMDRPHPLMPTDRAFDYREAIYYMFRNGIDDESHLLKVIKLATSWTFFGLTFLPSTPMGPATLDLDMLKSKLCTLIFGVFAGDTYLEVSEVRFLSEVTPSSRQKGQG